MGDAWSEDAVTAVIAEHADGRGPLLPVLHALQERFGCVDPRAVPLVAETLNLSRAEVHGVVTFYKDFTSAPRGRVVVQVCRAEACQAAGGRALLDHARRRLGVDVGGTSQDGAVTLDQVFCLGNCALGPAVTVAGRLHGRVDPDRLDALVDAARAGSSVLEGSS